MSCVARLGYSIARKICFVPAKMDFQEVGGVQKDGFSYLDMLAAQLFLQAAPRLLISNLAMHVCHSQNAMRFSPFRGAVFWISLNPQSTSQGSGQC